MGQEQENELVVQLSDKKKREYLISIICTFLDTNIALMTYYKALSKDTKAKNICNKSIRECREAKKRLILFTHIEILEYLYSIFVGNNVIAYSTFGKVVNSKKLLENDSESQFPIFMEELKQQKLEREEKEKARQESMEKIKKAQAEGKKVEMVWDKDTKTTKPMIIEEKPNA